MDPPTDSIDGLGLTFRDLTAPGQLLAIFRAVTRNQLSDEGRAQIAKSLTAAKATSDKNQQALQDLATPPTTTE